ncbi:related to allantoate permease [Phialocephala subalpina]|uniref:Related to allantoate permease n=1 Tax=Phialocephala subalpina TaxID=576137 RepID=A0A1L7WGW4_9HELO|nr:related to allantoate permease [Phialocephala subalpina]
MSTKDMLVSELHEFRDGKSTSQPPKIEDPFLINVEDYRRLEKKLIRKLDLTLIPMVWILYLFNYLDRNNIAQTKLNSFEKDLGLKGYQYNTAISILNVGYMLMQLPSDMILTRVRPSLLIPFWVLVWSCISASTAAASNYTHLIVIQFFLGIAEAPFFPGVFYLLSCWYTRKELGLRTAFLYSGLVLATAFSGLIAAGVFSELEEYLGHAGLRWLFIIEGVASFAFGIVAMFLLPDCPESSTGSTKWLLNKEERLVAMERMKRDRVSNTEEGKGSVWRGLKLACMDFKTWIFVVMLIANHTAYGFNYFYPSIVKGFNLGSTTITLVLTSPPYLLATISSMLFAYSSDRRGEPSFLFICGCISANAMVFSWASSSLSETPEKRAAATAMINLLSQLGNIWSPYFFRPQDSTRYLLAMLLMMAFSLLGVGRCILMKMVLVRENRKIVEEFEGSDERPNLYSGEVYAMDLQSIEDKRSVTSSR